MILAVVQARLTSSRLPGKVLMKVQGKPLLKYLIERLSLAKKLDKYIIAIPNNADNDRLKEFLEVNKIPYIQGDEDDVLQRFYTVGRQYKNVKTVVRLTADNPLVDPLVIDRLVDVFKTSGQYDYLRTGSSFANGQGVEVFTWDALRIAYQESRDAIDREHVTTYFKNNPERFCCHTIENEIDETNVRYTVDTPEDFEVVKKIIEGLTPSQDFFTSDDIRIYLDHHPEVRALNEGFPRNHKDGRI